jgi:transcription elongation factor Elf1
MPHYHNCAVCGQQVSVCSDEMPSGESFIPTCQAPCKDCGQHHNDPEKQYDHAANVHANYGPAYCSMHHPDPKFKVEQAPPPPRYAVLVKETADGKV